LKRFWRERGNDPKKHYAKKKYDRATAGPIKKLGKLLVRKGEEGTSKKTIALGRENEGELIRLGPGRKTGRGGKTKEKEQPEGIGERGQPGAVVKGGGGKKNERGVRVPKRNNAPRKAETLEAKKKQRGGRR